ncbi:MAG: hypothetical protein ACOY0T_02590 [Myxococcota bacterium]
MRNCLLGVLVLVAASAIGACGSDDSPANIAGTYSVNTTNGKSTCSFDWNEGDTSSGVPVSIVQNGAAITVSVTGLAAAGLVLLVGTADFDGSVEGHAFTATAYGKVPRSSGNCTYTVNATIKGSVSGDTIQGTVTYTPAGNGNPDCAALTCTAVQQFNGARPPT